MKHVLNYFGGNQKNTITVIEQNYEDDFTPVTIECESIYSEYQGTASFTFYDRKSLHDFIGTLLHVQQRMKGGKK